MRYEIYKFVPCIEKNWLSRLQLEKSVTNSFNYERLENAYRDIIYSIKNNKSPVSDGISSQKSMGIIELVYQNKV